tara:strand:+ start:253 stop:417 length:165 start_codon:yes stop_codon:yes gene_type:complete
MKYENRRYNKDETSKEFYTRRTAEMAAVMDSPAWRTYMERSWSEYRAVNNISSK